MGKNTAIYMDYDNIYVMLEKYYETGDNDQLKSAIIKKIKDKFKDDNILTFKAFADFQKINPVLTELQKNQIELRHVYSNNSEKATRKNASDIALTIDIIKSIYSKNNLIEKYIIVSSDSDMIPIINELRYFAKDIAIVYSEYGSSDGYDSCVDSNSRYTIESLLNTSKYVPISEMQLHDTIQITSILNIINDGIRNTYHKYKNGTASKKDLHDYLWQSSHYVRNDISLIIDYLFQNKILIESKIRNSAYNKVLINETFINTQNIKLNNTIITEQMYK